MTTAVSQRVIAAPAHRPEQQERLDLAVVIVNYRTPELVLDCLASLIDTVRSHGSARVVVVDNASGNGSDAIMERAVKKNGWDQQVVVSRSVRNGGFAAGNNLGIREISARQYLLINSDAYVRDGAVNALMQAMEHHPKAGIISPRLEWPSGEGQESCFNDIRPVHAFLHAAGTGVFDRLIPKAPVALPVCHEPCEPDWTSFACVLIRREVFEEVGLLDDGYFMYYDDADFCRRAREAGWTILHWPYARVVHLRGGSGPVKAATEARKRRPQYYYASRARYYAKMYGRRGLWWANLLAVMGRSLSFGREVLRTKQPHLCERETRDNWTNWRDPLQRHSATAQHQ